jgi:hypothetical protein
MLEYIGGHWHARHSRKNKEVRVIRKAASIIFHNSPIDLNARVASKLFTAWIAVSLGWTAIF